jgi:hypothetical protein
MFRLITAVLVLTLLAPHAPAQRAPLVVRGVRHDVCRTSGRDLPSIARIIVVPCGSPSSSGGSDCLTLIARRLRWAE